MGSSGLARRDPLAGVVATPTDTALLAAAVLVVLDGLLTLPFWSLEGNPVVLAIGAGVMLATKIVGVAALLWLWFGDRSPRGSILASAMPWTLLALHGAVVGSNLAVIGAVVS